MKDKVKELTKDTAVYGISTILSRFISFLLVPFYTYVLSKADYGIVNTTYSYIAFLNIVYLYGMDSAYMKYASLKKEKDKDIFSTPFLAVLFSSSLISLLLYLFRSEASSFMDIPSGDSVITVYIIAILFFDALSVIPFADLRLRRKARKFAAVRTAGIFINVLLNVALIRFFDLGLKAVFISNVISSFLTFVILLPDVVKSLRFRVTPEIMKTMLKFGLPYLPAGIASMVTQVADRPILQALTDPGTVGVYGANYKLGIVMMLYVSMFQYAWQPFFLNNAREPNAREIFAKVLTYFILAGSIILVSVASFLDIIKLLIGSNFRSGLEIIPIILLGYLFNGIYYNFTAGIFIKEKTRHLPYITGIGAAVNIAVNYLLIPHWGITGAALATLASYVVMAAVLFAVTQKFYKIDYEYHKIAAIFACIAIFAAGFYYIGINGHLLYKTGLFILFFILLIVFRIVTLSEINSIRNLVAGKFFRLPAKK